MTRAKSRDARVDPKSLSVCARSVSTLPSLRPNAPDTEAIAATGTDGPSPRKKVVPILCPSERGSVRFDAELWGQGGETELTPVCSDSLGKQEFEGSVVITGDGTRTHDLRIMRPPL
jgi:hypothetical protein